MIGHTSPETAYLVDDYPYGRTVRCRIRYWLEEDPKRGFRFCSQTENPKNLRWNAPKKSTYSLLAGAMYLDDKGHVTWASLTEYSSAEDVQRFAAAHPHAVTPKLRAWCRAKVTMYRKLVDGTAYMTINGERVPRSEADAERDRANLAAWSVIVDSD